MTDATKKSLPFDVLCLTAFPPEEWVGQTVLHPMEQVGDDPRWNQLDYDPRFTGDEEMKDKLVFDLGIVVEVFEHPDGLGDLRCRFMTDSGGSLHYGPANLWVPVVTQAARKIRQDRERERRGNEGGWSRLNEGVDLDQVYMDDHEWVWKDEEGRIRRSYGFAGGSQYKLHSWDARGNLICSGMAHDEPDWDPTEADGDDWWLMPSLRSCAEQLPIEE